MVKVALLGAAGGIGQPLSLLLKLNPLVTSLSLYDLVATPGIAADLGHICTNAVVKGYLGDTKDQSKDQLNECLAGAEVVIITAGVARKPGMTRDDLFNINAGIITNLATGIAKTCPNAFVCVITNPVNSTVPIVAEVLKHHGVYNSKRLFGVTTLDVVRANRFVSELKGLDATAQKVTVVGGHSGATIVPLLSQTGIQLAQDEVEALTQRIQFGGDEVVKAKDGAGSATLSMAYAASKFATSLIKALSGEPGIIEPSYVESSVVAGCAFFASNVELSKEGVGQIHGLGTLSAHEEKLLQVAVKDLKANIAKGVEFVKAKTANL